MNSELKFSIGYQLPDRCRISDIILATPERFSEVYFSSLGVSSGRGVSIANEDEMVEVEEELALISQAGVGLSLLWNAPCYGAGAISSELEAKVVESVERLGDFNLTSVTTASLFIAEVIKDRFPALDVRASVNMGIGTIAGMNYVKDRFDSFYLARELNRFPEKIRPLKTWSEAHGKKLYLLANSGCLRHCTAHTFHDNLVSHENDIRQLRGSGVGKPGRWPTFQGICWDYFHAPENHHGFIADSTWLRPEDLAGYDSLVDGVKLATRVHRNPEQVVEAYLEGRFSGNTLGLCEPDFSSLCVIDNQSFPGDWLKQLANLSEDKHSHICKELFNHVNR